MSCCVVLCCVVSCRVVLCCVSLCYCVALCSVSLCYCVALCCSVLQFVVYALVLFFVALNDRCNSFSFPLVSQKGRLVKLAILKKWRTQLRYMNW